MLQFKICSLEIFYKVKCAKVSYSFLFFTHYFVSQNKKLMPKFVLKEMESLYIEEMTQQINTLKANLRAMPVQQAKAKESKVLNWKGKKK